MSFFTFISFDVRPPEITELRIKNLRFKDNYAEGEIPFKTKTGSRYILLRSSFPYIQEWLNIHPCKTEVDAR